MSIACSDLLALAQKLAEQKEETSCRSSVSRAYYAAYHRCNDWHNSLKAPGSNVGPVGGVHQQLINRLRNPAPEVKGEERRISKLKAAWLEVLRDKRHKADYKLDGNCERADALQACADAKNLLE